MSDTLKTIVIGTSLTEASDDIVRTGAAIARTTGATPWLAYVHSAPVSPAELFGAVDSKWLEDLTLALQGRLVQQAQRTGLSALPKFETGQIHLAMGSTTFGGIVDLARQVKADLIVIGGSESGALHRILVGSTADGVIRQAPCPVLVVHSAANFPPARVEIPVDLSPISANALRQGMDFLARLGVGAGTEALFVLNPLEVAGSIQFTPSQIERFALDELHRFLKLNGASSLLSQVRTGYPGEEIPAVLAERGADLVILGTHGRRGFERLMVGSVALGVMHRATCNLLIVPPGARLQQETAKEHQEERAGADWKYVSDEVPVAATHA
jgi:nucleotide-binding universal stress UspA family protein